MLNQNPVIYVSYSFSSIDLQMAAAARHFIMTPGGMHPG